MSGASGDPLPGTSAGSEERSVYRYQGTDRYGNDFGGQGTWTLAEMGDQVRNRYGWGWRQLVVVRGDGPVPPAPDEAPVAGIGRYDRELGRIWWAEGVSELVTESPSETRWREGPAFAEVRQLAEDLAAGFAQTGVIADAELAARGFRPVSVARVLPPVWDDEDDLIYRQLPQLAAECGTLAETRRGNEHMTFLFGGPSADISAGVFIARVLEVARPSWRVAATALPVWRV